MIYVLCLVSTQFKNDYLKCLFNNFSVLIVLVFTLTIVPFGFNKVWYCSSSVVETFPLYVLKPNKVINETQPKVVSNCRLDLEYF